MSLITSITIKDTNNLSNQSNMSKYNDNSASQKSNQIIKGFGANPQLKENAEIF